ncbi:MAG: DUF2911 domain-containing protein [Bacteroidota bacterium]
MKSLFFSVIMFLFMVSVSFSQIMPLTLEPDGGNKKAGISEQIGIVKIAIAYSRPGVKGREGKIWGTPVAHYGFADQGHGTSYAAPWRAGANENTTMSFSSSCKNRRKRYSGRCLWFLYRIGRNRKHIDLFQSEQFMGKFLL